MTNRRPQDTPRCAARQRRRRRPRTITEKPLSVRIKEYHDRQEEERWREGDEIDQLVNLYHDWQERLYEEGGYPSLSPEEAEVLPRHGFKGTL